MRPRLPMISPM
ncbi:hypothetical protein Nmel_017238 [Mimus melanotis]